MLDMSLLNNGEDSTATFHIATSDEDDCRVECAGNASEVCRKMKPNLFIY